MSKRAKDQRELLRDSMYLLEQTIFANQVGRYSTAKCRLDNVDFRLGALIDEIRAVRKDVQSELREWHSEQPYR